MNTICGFEAVPRGHSLVLTARILKTSSNARIVVFRSKGAGEVTGT